MKNVLKAVLLMTVLAGTLFADGQMGSGGNQGCTGENCPPCTVDCPPPCTENCGRPEERIDKLEKEDSGQLFLGDRGFYYDAIKFIISRF
ncbi:MAG: hypothetical protein QM785_04650 [Pyrinomonadaceae bacterium]